MAEVLIDFYRGLREKYDAELYGSGIYFALDTKEILHQGISFLGELPSMNLVKDVAISEDGKKLNIIYVDGTTVSLPAGSGSYESAIEDKTLTTPTAIGGIPQGTPVSDLEGKSFSELFDEILYPTVYPTFVAPSATIAFNGYTKTQEVGAAGPAVGNFTTSFNAGSINLNGKKQADRAGALDANSSAIYVGGDQSDVTLPEVVALGNTSYQYLAAYAEGPQPYDNKGNAYGTPLPAGSVSSSAIKVNGTYPWFASTASATTASPTVKQSLIAWDPTAGAMTTPQFVLQPSGTLPQVFKLPRQLSSLQMLNTVSSKFETIDASVFTETTETMDINGNSREYYVYTYSGEARGSVTLIAKF